MASSLDVIWADVGCGMPRRKVECFVPQVMNLETQLTRERDWILQYVHAIRFNRLEDLCPCEQTKDMKFLEGQACRKPEFIKFVVVVAFSHPPSMYR